MVVDTLLHDIGDDLTPMNHSQYAASILRPYVSKKTYWIIQYHELFQAYYGAHYLRGNRNDRQKFKDNEHYEQQLIFVKIMINHLLIQIIKVWV